MRAFLPPAGIEPASLTFVGAGHLPVTDPTAAVADTEPSLPAGVSEATVWAAYETLRLREAAARLEGVPADAARAAAAMGALLAAAARQRGGADPTAAASVATAGCAASTSSESPVQQLRRRLDAVGSEMGWSPAAPAVAAAAATAVPGGATELQRVDASHWLEARTLLAATACEVGSPREAAPLVGALEGEARLVAWAPAAVAAALMGAALAEKEGDHPRALRCAAVALKACGASR